MDALAAASSLASSPDGSTSSPQPSKTGVEVAPAVVDGEEETSSGEDKTADSPRPKAAVDMEDTGPRKSSYKDYSRVLPETANAAPSLTARNVSGKEPTFPVKLHMILSTPEFQSIVTWLPHGRSWRIIQQKAFEERVIPLFFRHGRYSSFARQVNGWGFRRMTHGSDYNSYYHEMFLRGMPHLCEKMRRLTSKDAAARKQVEEEQAPDFYALSSKHPVPEASSIPLAPPPFRPRHPDVSNVSMCRSSLEAAMQERHHAEILNRMDLLASSSNRGYSQDLRAAPLQRSNMLSMGGMGNMRSPLSGGMSNPRLNGYDFGMAPPASSAGAANFAAIRELLLGSSNGEGDVAQFLAMENAARMQRARELGARTADEDIAQFIAMENARRARGFSANPYGHGNPYL